MTEKGRLRIRTGALIVRDDTLLLVRMQPPTRPHPIWMPPGGELEIGETLSEGLIREVHEETGLHVDPVRISMLHEFIEFPWHAVEFYFLCKQTGGTLQLGSDPERTGSDQILLDLDYVPFADFRSMSIYPEILSRQWSRLTSPDGGILHARSTKQT